jgi:RHS repeat-associated protein
VKRNALPYNFQNSNYSYPFGMFNETGTLFSKVSSRMNPDFSSGLMPGRYGSEGDYRYGFQGQEKDDKIKGEGNSVNYQYRMHDPRIGRFFAVDPLASKYPWNSPYAFSENKVIAWVELEGLESYFAADGSYIGSIGNSREERKLTSQDAEIHVRYAMYKEKMGLTDTYQEHYQFDQKKAYENSNPYVSTQTESTYSPPSDQTGKQVDLIEQRGFGTPKEDPFNLKMAKKYLKEHELGNAAYHYAQYLDNRYEGSQGATNALKDASSTVGNIGRVVLFMGPGGRVIGAALMGANDAIDTYYDFKEQGWKQGVANGVARAVTGKTFKTLGLEIPEIKDEMLNSIIRGTLENIGEGVEGKAVKTVENL